MSLRVFTAIFAAIGIGLLIACAVVTNNSRRFLAQASRASGYVLRLEASTSRDSDGHTSTVYHPIVRYRTDEGQDITFRSSTGTSPPTHDAGDRVVVLYDPARPGRAQIDSFWSLWLGTLILGIMGIAFTGAAYLVHRIEPSGFVGVHRGGSYTVPRTGR